MKVKSKRKRKKSPKLAKALENFYAPQVRFKLREVRITDIGWELDRIYSIEN